MTNQRLNYKGHFSKEKLIKTCNALLLQAREKKTSLFSPNFSPLLNIERKDSRLLVSIAKYKNIVSLHTKIMKQKN